MCNFVTAVFWDYTWEKIGYNSHEGRSTNALKLLGVSITFHQTVVLCTVVLFTSCQAVFLCVFFVKWISKIILRWVATMNSNNAVKRKSLYLWYRVQHTSVFLCPAFVCDSKGMFQNDQGWQAYNRIHYTDGYRHVLNLWMKSSFKFYQTLIFPFVSLITLGDKSYLNPRCMYALMLTNDICLLPNICIFISFLKTLFV